DWNVTARRGRPYVKRFVEERELSVVLLVDLSGSTEFGTGTKSNRDVAVEIAAVLTLSAIRNNDRVGLLLVTDRVERFVPRGSGRRHGLRLLRELLTWRPESRDTDLSDGLAHVARAFPRRSIVFLISDFVLAGPISDRFRDLFLRVSSRHDLIPVWLTDSRSEILPDLGWIRLADPETGESAIVDSGSREVREEYRKAIRARRAEVSALFGRACVDPVEVETKEDYVKPLVSFFRRAARAIP
ncbi:MAG: DUF58 domain-containing protein, partial [Gemmatimonadetes bacterium]|nr:DUF58 domain-containing protein [Gemmatimonadota bacterium]NIR78314.1 DUF58 domain-containing protein [Gemmatimonadota bacterium]NIT90110.1 DUF58 domain-containing protein [Gemmatimonadota bacterium]NIU30762.1 DUF58 domain-containing protein [Gemmatimonadota bacterium]NIU35555.1 DUF58 domain-containing protein [Gemmatimonadota bacterium]